MFLGCGEIAPVSSEGYAFAIFLLYLGTFVNFYFLGKASNIIETWLTESQLFQEKIDQANEVMAYINLEELDQYNLVEFYFKTRATREF